MDRLNIPNINSLHEEKDEKQKGKAKMFNIVLNKCIEKIIYTNRHTDQTFILFEVPHFLIGFPNYDRIECIRFLIGELKLKEYKAEYIDPFYLYIDWGTNKKTTSNYHNHRHNSNSNQQVYKNLDKISQVMKTGDPEKFKNQTKKLLEKFPNTSNIIFEYSDAKSNQVKQKKKK
jgi:hypothetical protein